MNIFQLYGYDTSLPYSVDSKTNVGPYALTGASPPPPPTSTIYLGSTNITSIYYGSSPVSAIYYGSLQVF
jgi:hypothetical protein